jgi:GntR family transcriptional regulator
MYLMNIKINPKSAVPVYEQVKREIKLAILSGRLKEGEKLMSIREMAVRLRINPNTILKVYYQLEVEGFIASRPGAGYFISTDAGRTQKEKHELFEQVTDDYITSASDLGYSIEDMIMELKNKVDSSEKMNNGGNDDKDR